MPAARNTGATVALAGLSLLTNLLGYGFTVVMGRALPVARFGELSALIGVLVVASVAGTALQAHIARRIAGSDSGAAGSGPAGSGPAGSGPAAAAAAGTAGRPVPIRLLADTVVVSLGVGLLVLVVAPALYAALDVDAWGSLLWLAAAMVPTTFAFGVQGLLQGEHRLVRLGVVLAAVQAAKLAAGAVAAATGGSIPVAFALVAAFTLVVVVAAVPLATPYGIGRPTWSRGQVTAWLRDAGAVLGVLVLTSLDLLLARHYLPPRDSGLYAAGNVVTRGGFWGPAFVALAGYPAFSDPAARRPALRRSALLLAVIAVVVIAAAWLAQGLLPVVLGDDYRPVAPLAWVFAIQGSALAALQLAVYAGLAVHDRRAAGVLWVVAVAEVLLVALVWHDTVRQIITVATGCSLVIVVVAVMLTVRPRRGPVVPDASHTTAGAGGLPTPG